ncbi:hypothetical protein UXB74_24400 [Escherichia marmotae]|nr:hypothetical protein [Escherichia marmotae]
MTAHKNISGTYHLSVANILHGVAALITTLDRRISDLLDEIIHFCEFQQSASHWQRVLH